ncbi:hypothetical protein FZ025_04535 [Xanthomonas hyacinthi]|nr:hypothetical protein FZ025_04535 [Xanthomonas hyacinthi]
MEQLSPDLKHAAARRRAELQELDELRAGIEQAGIELALAVLASPSVLLQPRKAAFDDPTFAHDLEGMQLTALGNPHCDLLAHSALARLRRTVLPVWPQSHNTRSHNCASCGSLRVASLRQEPHALVPHERICAGGGR